MRDEDCPTIYCNALCTQRQTQSHSDPASVLARVTARAAGSLWVGVNSTEPVRTWRSVCTRVPRVAASMSESEIDIRFRISAWVCTVSRPRQVGNPSDPIGICPGVRSCRIEQSLSSYNVSPQNSANSHASAVVAHTCHPSRVECTEGEPASWFCGRLIRSN